MILNILAVMFVFFVFKYVSITINFEKKIGLYDHPDISFYKDQVQGYGAIIEYFTETGNLFELSKSLKFSWFFKCKFYTFLAYYSKVTTDIAVITAYYLVPSNSSSVPKSFNINHIEQVLATIKMASNYSVIVNKLSREFDLTENEKIIVDFYILKKLCIVHGIHPIEWEFSELVINHFKLGKIPLSLGKGYDTLVDMVCKELSFMTRRDLKNALPWAAKAIYFSHPAYRDVVHPSMINKVATLCYQKFEQTSYFKTITNCFNVVSVTNLPQIEHSKAFIIECGQYLILPMSFRGNLGITFIPKDIHRHFTNYIRAGVNLNLWLCSYFLKADVNYCVVDKINPNLDLLKYKFDLEESTWDNHTSILHEMFLLDMQNWFNLAKERTLCQNQQ